MNATESFLASYQQAWAENRAELIASFWATDEPAPFYKAEEIDDIITDWDQLRAYWQHNEGFNEAIQLTFSDIKAQAAGADRQLMGIRMRWDIRFAADAKLMDGSPFSWAGKSMGGTNHVIALLKETPDGPRLMAWIEAPNAPISYIAELYLQNVSPGFGDS
ncbi:MAG: hypothetical protein JSV45_00090 [Chromatiales bacterium]|nr:MAG: hypothetical protein JSV45_00090 [Chromatiales bacterium]